MKSVIFAATALCVGLAAPVSLAQTVVTGFAPSTNTDPGVWFENDTRSGGTAAVVDLTGLGGDLESNAPLPTGAAKLLTNDVNGQDKAEVGVLDNYGNIADILDTLAVSYSWLKASHAGTQNLNAAPSLKLTIYNPVCDDQASAGDCYGAFVYEPYQNGYGNNPVTDLWQSSSVTSTTGTWWWTGGFGAPNDAGGPSVNTLEDWAGILSSDFDDAQLVLVSIGVGSYNNNQEGYFDDVRISHGFGSGYAAAYDFEIAPQFETLGECVSTLIAEECGGLKGRARAQCNHDQQMTCFDIFQID